MDEIKTFLENFHKNYPKYWITIDKYVNSILYNEAVEEGANPFDFKSSYYKTHICKALNGEIIYIPKDKANTEDIKKSVQIFEQELIDYDELFKKYDKNSFDIKGWCLMRLESEIDSIRGFLFDCSFYKGVFFINNLIEEINEIEKNLDNIWNIFDSNWLQKDITDKLKENLKHLKKTINNDLSIFQFELNSTITKGKSKDFKSNSNWYKIAETMANGTLIITNQGKYLFKGEPVKSEAKACQLVSKYLGNSIKASSIKPYLSKTKSPDASALDNDKNIFLKSRIDELKFIASEAQKSNLLSEYFMLKLTQLTKEK